jgi:flagella basal body P-ring formation protein FlgA
MAATQLVAVRQLNRGPKVRVVDYQGNKKTLSNTFDTVVDLNNVDNRRALAHHIAIGQVIVTAVNNTFTNSSGVGANALPANSAS